MLKDGCQFYTCNFRSVVTEVRVMRWEWWSWIGSGISGTRSSPEKHIWKKEQSLT